MSPSNRNSELEDGHPLRQLEDWERKVVRRVRRQHRLQRLAGGLRWLGGWRRSRAKNLLAAALVIALVGLLWINREAVFNWSGPGESSGGNAAYPTQSAPPGVAATTSATADPSGPFADTPAAVWAEGLAGLTVPAAKDVTGFSKSQVADHLAAVKQTLKAARLDEQMLLRHDTSAFLKLLAPGVRPSVIKDLDRAPIALVTFIDPTAGLSSHPPRVNGRISYSSKKQDGLRVLEIVTNFVWAYGFDNGEVVLIHDTITWHFFRIGDVRRSDLGLWLYQYDAYYWNVDCAATDRGLLAPPSPTSVPRTRDPDPEDPDNYFDLDHALDITKTC